MDVKTNNRKKAEIDIQDSISELRQGLGSVLNPIIVATTALQTIDTTQKNVLSLTVRKGRAKYYWGWVQFLLTPLPGTTPVVEVTVLYNNNPMLSEVRQQISAANQMVMLPLCFMPTNIGQVTVMVKTTTSACTLPAGCAQILLMPGSA